MWVVFVPSAGGGAGGLTRSVSVWGPTGARIAPSKEPRKSEVVLLTKHPISGTRGVVFTLSCSVTRGLGAAVTVVAAEEVVL